MEHLELKQVEDLLVKSNTEIKGLVDKSVEEIKTIGVAQTATKEALDKLIEEHKLLQKQADLIDERIQAKQLSQTAEVPLIDGLKKNTELAHLVERAKNFEKANMVPRCVFQLEGHHALQVMGRKTTLTSENVGGRTVTGVIPIERDAGIVTEARRRLWVREVLASRPTAARIIDFVKVLTAMTDAEEQSPEGSQKHENAMDFASASEEVRTVATWIPVSTQMLADWGELENFLRTSLAYYLARAVDTQLLYATGVGSSIHGIIPQATTFDTSLLPTNGAGSYTLLDVIGWAASQVDSSDEIESSWALMHPSDWWNIRMTKATDGRYLLGSPWSVGVPDLFGMRPIPTTAIAAGTFLIGSGNPAAAEVRPRMEITIAIGEQHAEFFTKNLVAIRAEMRLANVVKRPASFIKGSLVGSPA